MHLLMVGMLVDLLMHVELLPETETNQLTIQEGNPAQGRDLVWAAGGDA